MDEESLVVDTRFLLLVVAVAVVVLLVLSATLVVGDDCVLLLDCIGDEDFGGDGGVVGEAVVDIISFCGSYECSLYCQK